MASIIKHPKAGKTYCGKISSSLGLSNHDLLAQVKNLKTGLPYSRLAAFIKHTGPSLNDLAPLLQIPSRTLARRKVQGALTGLESERLARLAGLVNQAVQLFEGEIPAPIAWLRTPAKALANQPPLAMAETEIGARAVEDSIGRLEYGVFT